MSNLFAQPVVYDSGDRRMWLLREARELLAYRTLIRLLIIGHLKQRYRRSLLGLAWALIGPLVNTAVLSIAFTALFRDSVRQYPVYVLVGLVAWNFFSQTSMQGLEAAASGSGLLQRVYLPRSIFIVAAIGGGLINMGLALVALLVVLLITGGPLYATWLLLPLAVALLAIFTLGVTLLLAAMVVVVGDVAHFYQILVGALFFLSPIVYPRNIVPPQFAWIIELNPLSRMIDLFRALLYQGVTPPIGDWMTVLGLAVGALAAGYTLFAWKVNDGITYQ